MGTSTLSIDRFVARLTRQVAPAEKRPWPRSAKLAIWIFLALASWGVLILLGYSIWVSL